MVLTNPVSLVEKTVSSSNNIKKETNSKMIKLNSPSYLLLKFLNTPNLSLDCLCSVLLVKSLLDTTSPSYLLRLIFKWPTSS